MAEPKGYPYITQKNLSDDLKPAEMNRLFSRDIERRQSLPFSIAKGAQFSGPAEIVFLANAGAGDFSVSIPLNLKTVPLSMVWLLGSYDKDGSIFEGGGLLPGDAFTSGTVTSGVNVNVGALANYSCTKDELTIKLTSTNVGWPFMLWAQFYYSVFYDDTEVAQYGL